MSKVYLMCGPPRSGKDTATDHLISKYGEACSLKFAHPLHQAAKACLTTMNYEYYSNEGKDELIPYLGISYRSLCIRLSEEHFKPLYGDDFFGKVALAKIKSWEQDPITTNYDWSFIFSDSGFSQEMEPIINHVGPDNVYLFHIHRSGCDYSNDSRGYVDLSAHGIFPTIIENEDLNFFKDEIAYWYRKSKAFHNNLLG